jgi:hypothetical protein
VTEALEKFVERFRQQALPADISGLCGPAEIGMPRRVDPECEFPFFCRGRSRQARSAWRLCRAPDHWCLGLAC